MRLLSGRSPVIPPPVVQCLSPPYCYPTRMPPRSKKPQPIPADNGGWIRDLPKPSRRKKQQEPVLFEIPKGSSLAEMFLAGREQRHPPVAITEQQAPDRTADSNSASITQTSADQHADNSPSSQLHGLLQNQPEYCSTCKEEVTVEFAEEAADLVCCSQCGKVLRVLPIDDSSDNAPGPGPSEDRGRDRSENDSNSDRDDCKRQAVAPDSSDDMVLEPSEISPKTAGAASTADTADRIAADANQATPIADKERLQCELQSLNALIPQLVARKATLEAQLSASEAETASPPSANTQSQPAMQAEPSMQTKQTEPARQPPTDTGHSASTAPPAQPRTFRPPKQPRVAAPHGGRASYAAVAAGAAAGAAAAAAAAGAHAPKPPRKSSSTVTGPPLQLRFYLPCPHPLCLQSTPGDPPGHSRLPQGSPHGIPAGKAAWCPPPCHRCRALRLASDLHQGVLHSGLTRGRRRASRTPQRPQGQRSKHSRFPYPGGAQDQARPLAPLHRGEG